MLEEEEDVDTVDVEDSMEEEAEAREGGTGECLTSSTGGALAFGEFPIFIRLLVKGTLPPRAWSLPRPPAG